MALKLVRSPIAVVAGAGLNGLGVVRSLAKAGVPTVILDTDLRNPTLATRFGSKIQISALSGEAFIRSLAQVGGMLKQKPVLILTQEDSVETVSCEREQLQKLFLFSMPPKSTMQMLMNKYSFQQSAEDLKSPIPRSIRLTPSLDLERLNPLRYPCVIKPLVKTPEYNHKFAKAYKVSSGGQAAKLWSEMSEAVSEAIMQEWIEGDDSDVYFCLQYRPPSGPPVSFVGRKICQWPPMIGGTASCVSAPDVHDELVTSTNRYFDAVGLVGVCSMEYKRDKRDQRFYMVEPTVGRTDYQEEIATLNGVNIPYAAYCGELGMPQGRSSSKHPPRVWRDSMSYDKARSAGASDNVREISPHAIIIDALFRANDPMPYLAAKLEPFRGRIGQLLHRMWISKSRSNRD